MVNVLDRYVSFTKYRHVSDEVIIVSNFGLKCCGNDWIPILIDSTVCINPPGSAIVLLMVLELDKILKYDVDRHAQVVRNEDSIPI